MTYDLSVVPLGLSNSILQFDRKSGRDVDPEKPGCITSCRGGLTSSSFSRLKMAPIPAQLTYPRVIGSLVGSAPVEHPLQNTADKLFTLPKPNYKYLSTSEVM